MSNISDDHPAVEILRDLENTAYYIYKNLSGYIFRLARCIIQTVLRWANMLNSGLEVGVRPMYFFFLTQLPRVRLVLFLTLI